MIMSFEQICEPFTTFTVILHFKADLNTRQLQYNARMSSKSQAFILNDSKEGSEFEVFVLRMSEKE